MASFLVVKVVHSKVSVVLYPVRSKLLPLGNLFQEEIEFAPWYRRQEEENMPDQGPGQVGVDLEFSLVRR